MKITTCTPLIVSKDAESAIKVFEDMGFERIHRQEVSGSISDYTLKDPEGRRVDIAQADVEKDLTIIRLNVDDFDEAFEFLTAHGFINKSGRIVETPSSKSAMMVSPSGFAFDLAHHKKK